MAVFNGSVLFNGVDTASNNGLWTTNGAASGTAEITGIVGARTTGGGLDPTDMTVFNGEVLFNGVDANGLSGLWETDGTVGGTHEIFAGAGGASDLNGLNPTDLTVFGNEVLFNGLDQNGDPQLWVTNGTAAGTQQLTGVTGANASGIAPSDLTVFNGEVLFNGLDTAGQQQLWETNGTVAGTQEVTTAATGFRQGLAPSNMEIYDGQVLFSGLDANGVVTSLWTTDGTAAGTQEVIPAGSVIAWSTGLHPTDLTATTPAPTPPNFFNSVGKAGILWQNTNGDTALWLSKSPSGFNYQDLGVVGSGWQIAGTGDFNGLASRYFMAQRQW